ncbi:MAG: PEP-CTERM sorting domain-containing protein [Gammaproteobacteria bacterium]|jgi:hypothetical protein|nr:PEP-CTERM sorting domain-containing protein [Gammaproteobacteria bacterium]
MKKRSFLLHALPLCVVAAAALTSGAQKAQAGPIELSIEPTLTSLTSGKSLDVEIQIAGLDTDDLGAFELDLSFDPSVLQYQSYDLGQGLADPDPLFSGFGDSSDDSSAASGVLTLAEFSTLIDLTGQPDAFTLASVSFLAQQPGTSSLTLSNIALYDGSSLVEPLEVSGIANGSVTVPVPSTLLLMPLGLGLLAVRRFVANG